MKPLNKKGAGLIQGLVMGVAGLVIAVILAFVIVSTLTGAGLLTANSAEDNATDNLVANFSAGVNNISAKIPTILLVAAVVIILGVLVILWAQYKKMQVGGSAEL
jgi:cell division protein FtsX